MSSENLKYHLAVMWALLALSYALDSGYILDLIHNPVDFSDLTRGIPDETSQGPISNETESFQGCPEHDSNTAPPREQRPEEDGGYDPSERLLIARSDW